MRDSSLLKDLEYISNEESENKKLDLRVRTEIVHLLKKRDHKGLWDIITHYQFGLYLQKEWNEINVNLTEVYEEAKNYFSTQFTLVSIRNKGMKAFYEETILYASYSFVRQITSSAPI